MDYEFLDYKVDFFADRDEAFSSLKHEFSKIFHENNLHSFANASDIGFLDLGKLPDTDYTGDSEEYRGLSHLDNMISRPYHKEVASPYMGMNMNMHNSYSPMRFLQPSYNSNVNYNTSFTNMGNVSQKMTPGQDQSLYQTYPSYKYADYGYYDYPVAQQNNPYSQNMYDVYGQSDVLDTHPNNALSLMWSNEVKGGMTNMAKRIPSEEYLPPPQTLNIKRLSSGVSNEPDTPKKSPMYKIEQDFEKVSNKTLGIQIDRATKAIPETVTSGPRRTTRNVKPVFKASMANEDDESGSEDDKDDTYGDSKNRSSRGLRVLSLKVRDIVSRKKKTSYKEVADALLKDLSQKFKGKSQAEISKEEQNVKRRVYDALNVLIAAEILRKEGKLVCCEMSNPTSSNQGKKKNKGNRESILEQIEEIKKRKKEKVEALQELVLKSLAIRNLVRRNKEKAQLELAEEKTNGMYNPNNSTKTVKNALNSQYVNATRIDVVQENASFKNQTQDVIRFPFIVLVSSSPENSMNLNMDTSQKQLSIDSKKAFNIFGDIDVLLKMRLHYVSKDIFNKEIPKELRKYVSQSFIDALK